MNKINSFNNVANFSNRNFSGFGKDLERITSFPPIIKVGDEFRKCNSKNAFGVYNAALFFDHSMGAWAASYISEAGFAVRFWAMDPRDGILSLSNWLDEQTGEKKKTEEPKEEISE